MYQIPFQGLYTEQLNHHNNEVWSALFTDKEAKAMIG